MTPSKLLTLIIVAVIAPGSTEAQQESIPKASIELVKSSVVAVGCATKGPQQLITAYRRFGTGFFVNRQGTFVTAGHVLRDAIAASERIPTCTIVVSAPRERWSERPTNVTLKTFDVAVNNCNSDEKADIAACTPMANPFNDSYVKVNIATLPFISIKQVSDGTSLAFTGFPLLFGSPLTSVAHLAGFYAADNFVILDTNVWNGASGSPIYDFSGSVVGIVKARGVDQSLGLTYARPSDSIMEFLRKNKIAFNEQPPKSPRRKLSKRAKY